MPKNKAQCLQDMFTAPIEKIQFLGGKGGWLGEWRSNILMTNLALAIISWLVPRMSIYIKLL